MFIRLLQHNHSHPHTHLNHSHPHTHLGVQQYHLPIANEDRGIVVSESNNNEIYNNTVSDSSSGIDLDKDSFENIVHDNSIVKIDDPEDALGVEDGAGERNTLFSNFLLDSKNGSKIDLDQPD